VDVRVMVEGLPQLCSTAVTPILGPEVLRIGGAAMLDFLRGLSPMPRM
jgi:hypothetical protein